MIFTILKTFLLSVVTRQESEDFGRHSLPFSPEFFFGSSSSRRHRRRRRFFLSFRISDRSSARKKPKKNGEERRTEKGSDEYEANGCYKILCVFFVCRYQNDCLFCPIFSRLMRLVLRMYDGIFEYKQISCGFAGVETTETTKFPFRSAKFYLPNPEKTTDKIRSLDLFT